MRVNTHQIVNSDNLWELDWMFEERYSIYIIFNVMELYVTFTSVFYISQEIYI